MKIVHVVGARPNFMKAAPVLQALARHPGVRQAIVHTGQHYDVDMSAVFFRDLGLPEPDVNLEVGSGSHAQQTALIMTRFESIVLDLKPDVVLVYGDVNSTVAASLTCAKLLIPVGHVEAGLRAFDRTMPEEINRILTDQMAQWLFTSSPDGNENLLREGVEPKKIHLVGNTMIDTLVRLLPHVAEHHAREFPLSYALVTLHRPSNVDHPDFLRAILQALLDISQELPVIFSVHPRTRRRLLDYGLNVPNSDRFRLIGPMSYLESLARQQRATVVITDSGGMQEETTFLGVPCLTLRDNTERPVTVTMGTNLVIGRDLQRLRTEVRRILAGRGKPRQVPPLWDGQAATRIAQVLLS